MPDRAGEIVRAEAGRDRGGLFCVVGEEGGYLLLADGKRRRVEKPKRKKPGHVTALADAFPHPAIERLREGETPSNRDLRRALAAFRLDAREV